MHTVNVPFSRVLDTENITNLTNLQVQFLRSVRVFLHHNVFLCNNNDQTWFSYALAFAGPLRSR